MKHFYRVGEKPFKSTHTFIACSLSSALVVQYIQTCRSLDQPLITFSVRASINLFHPEKKAEKVLHSIKYKVPIGVGGKRDFFGLPVSLAVPPTCFFSNARTSSIYTQSNLVPWQPYNVSGTFSVECLSCLYKFF